MVIEVVRSALLSASSSPLPAYFVHASAHTCCPRLSLLFRPNRRSGSSPNSASGQLGESPHPSLGLAVPWALWAGGWPLGLNRALAHRRQSVARRTGPSFCSRTSSSAPP